MTSTEDRLRAHLAAKAAEANIRFTVQDITRSQPPQRKILPMQMISTRRLAFATLAAVMSTMAAGGWYLANSDQSQEIDSAAASQDTDDAAGDPAEEESGAPTSEAEPAQPAESPPVGRCGHELPLETTFGSPDDIISETAPTDDGALKQQVSHSSGASLELTWPARPRPLYDDESVSLDGDFWWTWNDWDDDTWFGVHEGLNGEKSIVPAIDIELTDGWDLRADDDDCESTELAVFQDGQELVRVVLQPGSSTAVRDWGPMVTSTEAVAEAPTSVLSCQDSDGPGINSGTSDGSVEPAPTPAEALSAFLDIEANQGLTSTGLHEMTVDEDRSVYYGVPLDTAPRPITSATSFVTLFSVQREAGGWMVTTWGSSGC